MILLQDSLVWVPEEVRPPEILELPGCAVSPKSLSYPCIQCVSVGFLGGQNRLMDSGGEVTMVCCGTGQIGNLALRLVWHFLHFVVSIWYSVLGTAHTLESHLISSGLLKSYKTLNLAKLRSLAIVVESEDAHSTYQVIELLQWLTNIGVKYVSLYDMEGVLKKSKEVILESLSNAVLLEVAEEKGFRLDQKHIVVEFLSSSDGKEAIAKAANVLLAKYVKSGGRDITQQEPIITEADMTDTLQATGYGGPDPDLLLVYGPARCHLGFPPWRMRFTEIVHMGSLKSMKFGSLLKAISEYTKVRQNYGS